MLILRYLINAIYSNKSYPQDNAPIAQKLEEISRIIARSKADPPINYTELREQERFEAATKAENEHRETIKRIIASTPKKPIPTQVDDGIDPNTLPKPTLRRIPPRTWNDSSETYEAPQYMMPTVSEISKFICCLLGLYLEPSWCDRDFPLRKRRVSNERTQFSHSRKYTSDDTCQKCQ